MRCQGPRHGHLLSPRQTRGFPAPTARRPAAHPAAPPPEPPQLADESVRPRPPVHPDGTPAAVLLDLRLSGLLGRLHPHGDRASLACSTGAGRLVCASAALGDPGPGLPAAA